MLNKAIKTVFDKYDRDYVITGEKVATVNEDNNLQHVFLVLTRIKYSKIPVVDIDNHFKGFISLSMITEKMLLDDRIDDKILENTKVKDVMETNVPVINDPKNIEVIFRFLVNENFLPVVDKNNIFKGIITRKEMFNIINFTLHTFGNYYQSIEIDQSKNED